MNACIAVDNCHVNSLLFSLVSESTDKRHFLQLSEREFRANAESILKSVAINPLDLKLI